MKINSLNICGFILLAVAVCSIASAQSLDVIGSCTIAGDGWAVAVQGNYAYIACDSFGLQVIYLSSPNDPQLVASYNTPGRAVDICVSGHYAYIADYTSLQIINISQPYSPMFEGSFQSSHAIAVHVDGDYAYLAGEYVSPSIKVLNIANPASPESVSAISFSGGAFDCYHSQGHLAVLSNITEPYSNFLRIVDVADPQNPILIGNVQIPGNIEIPMDVKIVGNYAYIADGNNGLQIINMSDPANPGVIGAYDSPGRAWGVVVDGNFVFMTERSYGVEMISVSNPSIPQSVAYVSPEGIVYGVTAANGLVYVSGSGWLFVLRPDYPGFCHYVPGDVNGSGQADGIDVLYAVSYLKGRNAPPDSCNCPPMPYPFFAAGDVNGNCEFNGVDVSFFVRYLQGRIPALLYCADCPPASSILRSQPIQPK